MKMRQKKVFVYTLSFTEVRMHDGLLFCGEHFLFSSIWEKILGTVNIRSKMEKQPSGSQRRKFLSCQFIFVQTSILKESKKILLGVGNIETPG